LNQLPALSIAAAIFSAALARNLCAADKTAAPFEGTVSVTLTRAGIATQSLFTRKGNQLRVEYTDKSNPEPINIVDLAAGRMTIIYPHNSTFVHVDLMKAAAPPSAAQLPPRFPTPPISNASQSEAATAAHPAPSISPPPGFPTPPAMPPMPNNPMASGMPNMPMMPPLPAMMPGGAPELKKTGKTKKIQGLDCTLYTISDRMENFEIWATADSALFPFRLLQHNYMNRHFGPFMLEEQWVELLQKKSLFPLEATLRMEHGGSERLSFKVDKIEKKKIDNDALFKVPENYYEIQPPPF
jgi:uncharacterized protein DUF4412